MKKFLFFIFVCSAIAANAQSNWQPMFLTVSGNHVVDGVEGWFSSATCENESVVFIKFVNTNSTAVTIHWYPAVFTQERTWITHNADTDLQQLSIDAGTTLEGKCGGLSTLVIKLADFGISNTQFFKFNASEIRIEFK